MWRGYTMGKKPKREAAFLAFYVGKSSHRACAVDEGGEVLINRCFASIGFEPFPHRKLGRSRHQN